MATAITSSDVKDGFTTSVPDGEIDSLISVVDEADTCLDANSVSADKQKMLKLYAVRHLLTMQANQGRGTVASQSAPSGASQSFSSRKGMGLQSTFYGDMLKQIDDAGCVLAVINNAQQLTLRRVGRRDPDF